MSGIRTIGRELRQASRALRRTPLLTCASVVMLALGIGANTALFSVVYGVLLRPLPYRDPSALVQFNAVQETNSRPLNFSLVELADWEERTRAFEGVALFSTDLFAVREGATLGEVKAAIVSSRFFDVLGGSAQRGRLPGADRGGGPRAVVSDRFWRQRLARRADVVGQSIELNGLSYAIVGVAAADLRFPADDVDVWVPLEFVAGFAPARWKMRGFRGFSMVGRLKAGIGLEQARDDAAQTARWLAQTYPRFSGGTGVTLTRLSERMTGVVRPALLMLFAAVSLMLLVACANLANLSLVRSAARRRETAIRIALGASRAQILRQCLAESAVLAVGGACAGLVVAQWSIDALVALRPDALPRLADIHLDVPVLAFTLVLTTLVTVIFGTLPAFAATRVAPLNGMRDARTAAGRGVRRLHAALIVAEIATSVVLLVGGALLARSLMALVRADIGVRPDNVLTLKLNLASADLAEPARQTAALARAVAATAALPGVRSAAITSSLPPSVSQMHTSVSAPGASGVEHELSVEIVSVSPGVFATLGIPIVAGRTFDERDTAQARRVVVLGEQAARRLFPDGAVGRTLPVGPSDPRGGDPEVVGVVGDVKYSGLDAAPDGAVYIPFAQRAFRSTFLVLRSDEDPLRLGAAVRRALGTAEPSIGMSDARPLDAVVSAAAAQPRFRTWLLALMAGLTIVMAAVGLYGVVAHSVASRTAEIGVRMALGASPAHVLRMVASEGMSLSAAGVVFGIAAALVLSRSLTAFLYGVGSTDALSYVLAGGFIMALSLVGTIEPARRAAAVDPLIALRSE